MTTSEITHNGIPEYLFKGDFHEHAKFFEFAGEYTVEHKTRFGELEEKFKNIDKAIKYYNSITIN